MATEPQEQTDLGKDVERAIEEFWLNCQSHGSPKLALADCAPCQLAKGLLESAIRARIDQASFQAQEASFEGTPLPPHEHWCKQAEHATCLTRGYHICGCGAVRPFGYVGEDSWVGEWSAIPDEDRTSKHSMPRPIVTGSRAHQLAATVYDLLGFNEPGMVAQWITEARRLAGGRIEVTGDNTDRVLRIAGMPLDDFIQRIGTRSEHEGDRKRLLKAIENLAEHLPLT